MSELPLQVNELKHFMALDEREKDVLSCLVSGSGTKISAYLGVYKTHKREHAVIQSSYFFSRPEVKAALAELWALQRANRLDLQERLIESLEQDAFFDISAAFKEDGSLKPIHEIPLELRQRIAAVKPNRYGVTVEFISRLQAKQMLLDVLGIGQHGQGLNVTINLGDTIDSQPREVKKAGHIDINI